MKELFKMHWNPIFLMNFGFGIAAGVIICLSYILSHREKNFSKSFAITMVLLPAICTIVIPLVTDDIKKAVSLAGIFALIRFRSMPGDSKDILYVFFSLVAGFAFGLGFYSIGIIMVITVSLLFVILSRIINPKPAQILKITIPEDMNYQNAFDDLFEKYLAFSKIKDVRTSNMGTLFTISYTVRTKENAQIKEFMDQIRTRNGNLTVILQSPDDSDSGKL